MSPACFILSLELFPVNPSLCLLIYHLSDMVNLEWKGFSSGNKAADSMCWQLRGAQQILTVAVGKTGRMANPRCSLPSATSLPLYSLQSFDLHTDRRHQSRHQWEERGSVKGNPWCPLEWLRSSLGMWGGSRDSSWEEPGSLKCVLRIGRRRGRKTSS